MSRDYLAEPVAQVRRADRAVEDETWIRALLHRVAVGTLATSYDGQPFVNMNLFAYDEAAHTIYMHTARVGRTRSTVENNELVCFGVNEMGRLLPADTALNMSVEYNGVVVFGKGHVVEESAEMRHGLQLLLDKYFAHLKPGEHYRPMTDEELARTAVYAIRIESWSGKKKEVAADFPNAFYYGSQPTNSLPSGE